MPKRFAIIAAALARNGRAIPASFSEDWLSEPVIIPRTSQLSAGRGSPVGNDKARCELARRLSENSPRCSPPRLFLSEPHAQEGRLNTGASEGLGD